MLFPHLKCSSGFFYLEKILESPPEALFYPQHGSGSSWGAHSLWDPTECGPQPVSVASVVARPVLDQHPQGPAWTTRKGSEGQARPGHSSSRILATALQIAPPGLALPGLTTRAKVLKQHSWQPWEEASSLVGLGRPRPPTPQPCPGLAVTSEHNLNIGLGPERHPSDTEANEGLERGCGLPHQGQSWLVGSRPLSEAWAQGPPWAFSDIETHMNHRGVQTWYF